jgi:hypothetical protein
LRKTRESSSAVCRFARQEFAMRVEQAGGRLRLIDAAYNIEARET